jgi:xanthine dehydrogenase YagR molybdenum-binding subunit
MTRAMYACPNIHTEQRLSRSDTNTGGFMRAPNEMQTFSVWSQRWTHWRGS